jgi:hypothetical protein
MYVQIAQCTKLPFEVFGCLPWTQGLLCMCIGSVILESGGGKPANSQVPQVRGGDTTLHFIFQR